MRRVALLLVPLFLPACDREPVAPTPTDAPALAMSAIRRPVNWTVMDLECPDGSVRSGSAQWQSVVPLGERGDLILVGGSDPLPPAGCAGREDWFVYDLSSGEPVLLDAINTGAVGVNIGVDSPRGSTVGFAVEGNVLTVYEGGFRTVLLPMVALAVWAASPTDVWLGGSGGKIIRYDGNATFVVEHDGGGQVWSIWGHGPTARFARTLTGILERHSDGTWTPVALPTDCDGQWAWGIVGDSPNNVWATGVEPGPPTSTYCLLHYDGTQWVHMAGPPGGGAFAWVWPLDAGRVLVAGQQVGLPAGSEQIAFWGSTDLGQTWAQFSDPRFIELAGSGDRGFFALSATTGGNRIYLPTIMNGKLLLGTPQDFSAITAWRLLGARPEVVGTEAPVEPLDQ